MEEVLDYIEQKATTEIMGVNILDKTEYCRLILEEVLRIIDRPHLDYEVYKHFGFDIEYGECDLSTCDSELLLNIPREALNLLDWDADQELFWDIQPDQTIILTKKDAG